MNKILPGRWIAPWIAGVILSFSVAAQDKTVTYLVDPSSNPPELSVSLKHLKAEVGFVPTENKVIAQTEFTFIPLRYQTDSIVFYAPDFTVKSAIVDKKAVGFRIAGSNLVIDLKTVKPEKDKEYHLFLDYEARPLSGMIYFIGWKPWEQGKRKEIWAHRPHGWLPYMDARITMDMRFTFDSSYSIFANGERVGVTDNHDGTLTWHYRMDKDHPFFSTAVVIGPYDFKTSRSTGGVPLEFWYYRGQENKVKTTYAYTGDMMDFLEKEIGIKYPYPVYRQAPVIDYMYGAMETTTSTVFGDYMLIDRGAFWQRNYINTNAHEMAHQWFGNGISHFVNKDVWLTESFATYYAKIFELSVFGEDAYQNLRKEELDLVLNAAKTNNYPVGGTLGGVARIYQKGSLVLDMLRYVMGDREFRDAIRLYAGRHLFGYAETSDLLRAIYDATGKSYNWFFDEWVLHGGEPNYKVSFTVRDDTAGNRFTDFRVSQTQETNDLTGLFRMPVLFEVHYTDGSSDILKVMVENKFQEISIPNKSKKPLDFVLFDPGRHVVKKVTFDRPFEELSAQALRAPGMIDRYDALVALRSFPIDKKREVLVSSYNKETFHLTRSEIIAQLSGDNDPSSMTLLKKALDDPEARVRKAVLQNVSIVPGSLKPGFEKALRDTSYQNIELALGALCSSFPGETGRYLELTRDLTGWRGLNIRMKWLEIALGKGMDQYRDELISYTGPVYEFETRMNSLYIARKLNISDERVLQNAISAYLHWNSKLSNAGKEVLLFFAQETKSRETIEKIIRSRQWSEKERTSLNNLLSLFN